MTVDNVVELHGTPVLVCSPDGPVLAADGDALELIAAAFGQGAEVVAVPVARLAPEFFTLRSRLAGDITQKFVNYRLRLVVVGDIDGHLSDSSALQAFVAEANRGGPLWFVSSMEELEQRLHRAASG